MTLDLPATLAILFAGLAAFGFSAWRASRPPNPLKVRMINYHLIQIITIIVLLLMLAHLATLFFGHPVTGGRNLGAP
jgi:uncharacterized protein (DUF983 family)